MAATKHILFTTYVSLFYDICLLIIYVASTYVSDGYCHRVSGVSSL